MRVYVVRKWSLRGEVILCVVEYHTGTPAVTVQRAFRAQYANYHCHVTSQALRHGSLQQQRISMHPC